MLPVFIDGKELQREKCLKNLGIPFYRSLCGNLHISRTFVNARKGLVVLKTMAAARMSQKITIILYKALILQGASWGLWYFFLI